LSLLLIEGSMVQKEALGRLDAETAVLSFLIEFLTWTQMIRLTL